MIDKNEKLWKEEMTNLTLETIKKIVEISDKYGVSRNESAKKFSIAIREMTKEQTVIKESEEN